MARLLSFFYTCLFLLDLSTAATVTIKSAFNKDDHSCISECLWQTYIFTTDLGRAMGCGTPYDEACFCATATASVSVADSWMSRCASSQCGRGDYTRDLSTMQSYYASYCMAAGFTQPGATKWYTPAEPTEEASAEASSSSSSSSSDRISSDAEPSRTADSGAAATTTEVTVITQTAEGGSVVTKTQVIVHATSTLVVNADGSPVSTSSSDNTPIKIGVGIGVAAVVILALGLIWFFRRKRRGAQGVQPSVEFGTSNTPTVSPMSAAAVGRKPVASSNVSPVSVTVSPATPKTNELSGEGVKVEVGGQQVQPFVTPSPPVQFPGRYEINGETATRPEMNGLGRNPYVEMSGEARPPELAGHVQTAMRPEMHGQGRNPYVEMSGEARPPELAGHVQTPPPRYAQYQQPNQQPAQRWELPDNARR